MYLGVFTKCRGHRNISFIGVLGEGINFSPEKYKMSLGNCTTAKRKEALKTKQGMS